MFWVALGNCLTFCILISPVIGSNEAGLRSTKIDSSSNSSKAQISKVSTLSSSSSRNTITSQTYIPASTCPTGTINYITHTLPQQCLKNNRSSPTYTSRADSTPQQTHITGTRDVEAITASPETSQKPIDDGGVSRHDVPSESNSSDPHTIQVTVASDAVAVPTPTPQPDEDLESALDNANFLSFEEWKVQNLAKAGQSPENLGRSQNANGQRQRPDLATAFDTLGEEHEIEIDFAGFGGGGPELPRTESSSRSESTYGVDEVPSTGTLNARSKDAGKTCKERTNYASFDCAATILKSNKESKSASAILVEHKDSYMLNKCSADNKFIIIELCDDILVDTIVLSNYEFFSSSFRHFRVSVSDRYPVKLEKWKDLGTYEARNTREIQAFLVENPLIWARYLRIEFLTHYGSEYYCPVSLLRVHGTTMLEEFRHQEDAARGDEDDIASPVDVSFSASASVDIPPMRTIDASIVLTKVVETMPVPSQGVSDVEPNDSRTVSSIAHIPSQTDATASAKPTSDIGGTCAVPRKSLDTTCAVSHITASRQNTKPSSTSSTIGERTALTQPSESRTSTTYTVKSEKPEKSVQPTVNVNRHASNATVQSAKQHTSSSDTNNASYVPTSQPAAVVNSTSSLVSASSKVASKNTNSTNTERQGASSTSSTQPAQPSTQESFFKSVHKRLQQLESNSTLSLKYIEEQSRILRDAFAKVEKRQVATTSHFLSNLNLTVTTELHGFRQAYEHLWQSTVIELDGQRQQNQREMLALSARLTMMADELVWQKRMGILQSTLLIFFIVLVLFGRSGNNGYLEMPMMQQMMNRSTAALRASWDSPPVSPSPDGRSPVSIFRKRIWRASPGVVGEGATDSEKEGLDVRLEPPTPSDHGSLPSDDDDEDDYHDTNDDDHDINREAMCLSGQVELSDSSTLANGLVPGSRLVH